MRYLSVCSGIEAATVAWHSLGWTPAAFAEIEPFPSAVLAHHYPHVPNLGDFTKIEAADVGPIDLLVGGTPCQSFSVAGKRLGLDDPRGNLALEFCRLARRLRPRWVVWENVPGVHSSWSGAPDGNDLPYPADGGSAEWTGDEDSDFGAFLDTLEECGYSACWRRLDSQYGRVDTHPRAVPQRRERVLLVGYLGDWRPAAAVLLEPEGLRGDPPPRRCAGQEIAGSLGAGSERSGGRVGRREAAAGHLVAATLEAAMSQSRGAGTPVGGIVPLNDLGGASRSLTASRSRTGRLDPNGETLIGFSCKDHGADAQRNVTPTLRAMGHSQSHANAGGQLAVAHTLKGDGFDASADGAGRIIPVDITNGIVGGDVAGTLEHAQSRGNRGQGVIAFDTTQITSKTCRSKPVDGFSIGVQQSWAVRRLTPRECERLQAFPDDYTLIRYPTHSARGKPLKKVKWAKDGPRYRALGNSMSTNIMRWVGQRIDLFEKVAVPRRTGRALALAMMSTEVPA